MATLNVFLILFSVVLQAQTINDQNARITESCKKTKSDKTIWVFKQWHLSPSDNTKDFPEKTYPQKENLRTIYEQLYQWVLEERVQLVIAEGCSGEIDDQFALKFNGWTMSELKQNLTQGSENKIIGHIPMMIEAQFGEKIKTLCGDHEKMIEEQNLKFSDLRAAIGFLTRLEKFEGKKDKEKPYIEAIKSAYKIKRKLSGDDARLFLKNEVKKLIKQIEKGIERRNQSFLEAASKSDFKNAVVVIGGIHAKDLKVKLEKNKFNCHVVEFKGYDYDEEELLRKIKSYFN